MNKRFVVATLGCRTNQYESQAAKDQLLQLGFVPVGEGEEADVCVVNTCTVTESADAASRHEIRGLLRRHPEARVIVTGCMAERTPEAVKALGDAQWWFGEDQGRYIVTTKNPNAIHRWCNAGNLARYHIGYVAGSALNTSKVSIPLTALREASDSFFRDWMES